MKNLKSLRGAKVLSKEEMKDLKGGAGYVCQCSDGSAVWTGKYASSQRAAQRAAYWCEGGGNCYPANGGVS